MQPAKSSRPLPAAAGSASPPLPPARPGNVFPPGPRRPSAFPSPRHPSPRHRSSSDHRHAHPQGPQTQPFKPSPLRSSLVASAEDAPSPGLRAPPPMLERPLGGTALQLGRELRQKLFPSTTNWIRRLLPCAIPIVKT
ncbi:hypothetical protein PYCCODRAFT_713600 [Trametes coccinea BRFM310]|uniref:Uncharacterized protein n=1 Tax=Trametes coccinea (strain BRFM310) TaxID=1353009 RepID=A0A1Y2IHT1_TRAC3|nr:hypothetical protein PYCCODRAFT_713600 [Trametes coccinea BRFM310]